MKKKCLQSLDDSMELNGSRKHWKKSDKWSKCQQEVFTKDLPGEPERARWRISSVRKIKQKTEEWNFKTK